MDRSNRVRQSAGSLISRTRCHTRRGRRQFGQYALDKFGLQLWKLPIENLCYGAFDNLLELLAVAHTQKTIL
jgi:hypothetical protein